MIHRFFRFSPWKLSPFPFYKFGILHYEVMCYFYLFMAVLGLRFCARAFSSCGKWGPLFIAVCEPLTIMACLVAEHRLRTHRLSGHGSRAQPLHGMWDLPVPGHEPVSPCISRRTLNYCATREALKYILKK